MRSIHRLRSLFKATAAASVAVACGGGTASDPADPAGNPDPPTDPLTGTPTGQHIDRRGFSERLCGAATSAGVLAGVTSNPAFDFLELRSQGAKNLKVGDPQMWNRTSTGTACKTATDAAKCTASLDALTGGGWQTGGMMMSYSYFAYTRGDEVGALESADAVKKFILPVDTANDAALIASFAYHGLSCEGANVRRASNGGFDLVTTTGDGCGPNNDVKEHIVNVSPNGDLTVVSSVVVRVGSPNCSHGRRPEGLGPTTSMQRGLAGFLSEMALLEAASVHAFDRLARELEAHGAPRRLVRGARRARKDEIRHAKMATKLARRAGGTPVEPEARELPTRDLFAIAMENATEGCVAETFAALLAEVQALRANDAAIRRAMKIIAEDETRHAALAWDVAEWIEARLTPEQRAEVSRARRDAASALRASHHADFDRDVQTRAGMPSGREARALVDAIEPALWAA